MKKIFLIKILHACLQLSYQPWPHKFVKWQSAVADAYTIKHRMTLVIEHLAISRRKALPPETTITDQHVPFMQTKAKIWKVKWWREDCVVGVWFWWVFFVKKTSLEWYGWMSMVGRWRWGVFWGLLYCWLMPTAFIGATVTVFKSMVIHSTLVTPQSCTPSLTSPLAVCYAAR